MTAKAKHARPRGAAESCGASPKTGARPSGVRSVRNDWCQVMLRMRYREPPGRRKAPPDDRLRNPAWLAAGLLRRVRLRSLSYVGQVAPRGDAAGAQWSVRPTRAQAQSGPIVPDS